MEPSEQDFHLPPSLESVVEKEGKLFKGRVYRLNFTGASLFGEASLTKYTEPRKTFWGSMRRKKEYSAKTGIIGVQLFIYEGKPRTERTAGYRARLVARLAYKGINISKDVLEEVFHSIDETLLQHYRKVFPNENPGMQPWKAPGNQTPDMHYAEGSITEIIHTSRGITQEPVTLYTIKGEDSTVYRVGRIGIHEDLEKGAKVKVEFDLNIPLAHYQEELNLPTSTKSVLIVPSKTVWHQMTGYKKLE